MSPAASRRFRVTLLVARHLTYEMDAACEEHAVLVAESLFKQGYGSYFHEASEDVVDAFAEPLGGEGA